MHLVSRPMRPPYHCAILPQVGQTHPTARWVDTGSTLGNGWDAVIVSDIGVTEAARALGLPTRDEFASLSGLLRRTQRDLEESKQRVVELEAALLTAEEQLGAVHVLKQAGYQASRKPGRPPKERVA